MITGLRSFFLLPVHPPLLSGLSWGLGMDADHAFLIVGGITFLFLAWLFLREKPRAQGDAKLASADDAKRAGLSRDR